MVTEAERDSLAVCTMPDAISCSVLSADEKKHRISSVISRNSQKGVSIVEFVVVAPLLIFFLLTVVDMGRALFAYLSLNHIVGEGVAIGTRTYGLDIYWGACSFTQTCNDAYCENLVEPVPTGVSVAPGAGGWQECHNTRNAWVPTRLLLHERVRGLLKQEEKLLKLETVRITSGYNEGGQRGIKLSITGEYKPLFIPFFLPLRMSVNLTGPFVVGGGS